MGYRFFSSPATVSGVNQLRLFDGVEVGGEAVGDVEAYGVGLAERPWFGVAGAEGGGEHVPVFGGGHEHRVEAIGCADEGFGEVIFEIRMPKAP
jgi:hypothetical protein